MTRGEREREKERERGEKIEVGVMSTDVVYYTVHVHVIHF